MAASARSSGLVHKGSWQDGGLDRQSLSPGCRLDVLCCGHPA
jgi:hypothetical protein